MTTTSPRRARLRSFATRLRNFPLFAASSRSGFSDPHMTQAVRHQVSRQF